jgi:predicted deacylase
MSTDHDDHDDEMSLCEQLGHDDYVFDIHEDGTTLGCRRCGAEWWEDFDEA